MCWMSGVPMLGLKSSPGCSARQKASPENKSSMDRFCQQHYRRTRQLTSTAICRSADLQSAVSQILNLQRSRKVRLRTELQRPADCKSAIQQIANLRYGSQAHCKSALRGQQRMKILKSTWLMFLVGGIGYSATTTAELKNISVNGGIDQGKARLTIEANLNGLPGDKDKAIYSTSLQHALDITRDSLNQSITATFDILEGAPAELVLTMSGEGEVREVTGKDLQD